MFIYNEEALLMQMFYFLQKKIVLGTDDIALLVMLNDKNKSHFAFFFIYKGLVLNYIQKFCV